MVGVGGKGGGFAQDCYELSLKVIILVSSLCPPTETFEIKSTYFGPHKDVCISVNLQIDGQPGGHMSNSCTDGGSRKYAGGWRKLSGIQVGIKCGTQ